MEEHVSMKIINPNAAGIDIGSRSHWVAIGQNEKDVREFGVFNEDLYQLSEWLKRNKIQTVAMESTGTYWQSLFAVLTAEGFEVILCNGKFTKNIKGKKTDIVLDPINRAFFCNNLLFLISDKLPMVILEPKVK